MHFLIALPAPALTRPACIRRNRCYRQWLGDVSKCVIATKPRDQMFDDSVGVT